MKQLAFLVILFLLGCGQFTKVETSELEKSLKTPKSTLNFCPVKRNTTQIFGQNENIVKAYQDLLKKLRSKKIKLASIDKYVLYALMQMNARPDQASPTARHQVFFKIKGKDYYFDFYAKKKSAYPFFFGLDYLLKYFSSGHSLKALGQLLDKYQKGPILVSETFYNFLKQNELGIKKDSTLAKNYLHGGQILRPGESIPRPNYKFLVSKIKRGRKDTGLFKTLIKHLPGKSSQINTLKNTIYCNMDLNLYEHSLYLSQGPIGDSASFALLEKGFQALGVTSQQLNSLKSLWNTSLFKATGNPYQAKFCKIKGPKGEMVFVSSKGKDPGQHLFHFLNSNVQYSSSFKDIDNFISSPRHLYLVNPLRIIYESKRGSKKRLDDFLNSGIPIYYSSSLGLIWGWGKFDGLNSLIKDPRNESFINCPKTAQQ